MNRVLSLLAFIQIALLGALPSRAGTFASEMRKSVLRINVTAQEINYRVPWMPGGIFSGVGAGFVIDGKRILTNAHVVSNSRFLTIEKEDDPKKYPATVEHVAHDCDLAVLKVADPEFFKGTAPLHLGGIPEIESAVSVYGYPIGGEHMSVTNGIVSRVDFQIYTHPGADSHLAIQISAPINPGNSGGPVMQEGKVVGVAFQGYSGDVAQNVGYMIPTSVVRRFLKDIEDGHYDRYMDLSISTLNLQNPAMRRALGLTDSDTGIMVSSIFSGGSCAGKLQVGDVLLAIDDLPIASDASVQIDGQRMQMSEIVERKFRGDSVKLHILRDQKEQDVAIKLEEPWPYTIQSNQYDVKPRFIVFGGLVFQPLSRNLIEAFQIDDLRIRYMYDFFASKEIYLEHPEIVILSSILPDPVNTYFNDFRNGILDEVNGKKIKTLKDAAAAFSEPEETYVLKMLGSSRPIVLERKAVEEARERILRRYNVSTEQNLEE
jgi:S1-C subfamily serine protease